MEEEEDDDIYAPEEDTLHDAPLPGIMDGLIAPEEESGEELEEESDSVSWHLTEFCNRY